MRYALLLIAVLWVSACDSSSDGPVTYQGVQVESRGSASLAVESRGLVVSGLDGTRSGGFAVAGTPTQVDVEIEPLALGMGERFGIAVQDASGAEVASMVNVGQGDGRVDFQFAFADALPVVGVFLTYRLGGRNGDIVLEGFLDLGAPRQGRRAAASAGSGEGNTGSTHVIRENGRYVVVSDSEKGAARSADCQGFLVTPPALLGRKTVCTDWIEVEPQGEFEMPEGEVSVTAQGVGSFTVRTLAAQ